MNNRNLLITVLGLIGACVCGACLVALGGFAVYNQQISSLLATPTSTPSPSIAIATPTPPGSLLRTTPTSAVNRGTPTRGTTTDPAIVLSDNFTGACNLPEGDNDQRTFRCENGSYTMLNKTKNSRWVYYTDELPNDVVIEADARVISGTGFIEYGIIFRAASDGHSYYSFTLTRDGQFTVFRCDTPCLDNKSFVDLISYTSNSAIKTGVAANRIKVVAQGNQLAVFVNDQWLNTVTDAKYQKGSVGFFLNNREANAKTAFSNLRVSQITTRLVLPKGIPTMTPTPPR